MAKRNMVVEENTQLICLEKVDDEKDKDLETNKTINIKNEEFKTNIDENYVDDNETNSNNTVEDLVNDGKNEDNVSNDKDKLIIKERAKRKITPVSRYGNSVSHCIYVNYIDANVPNTFEEAMNSHDHKQWEIATDSERPC
ncbi:unnamed protein product [Arctia plantaginis]|uniref:Uncharacterized protein n=1 Tax=Arctia plantaginis TaxID=874455 RepID=A0A8S1AFC4_ARCPL|nr:unnamed protein product [Arctia plantaginis]